MPELISNYQIPPEEIRKIIKRSKLITKKIFPVIFPDIKGYSDCENSLDAIKKTIAKIGYENFINGMINFFKDRLDETNSLEEIIDDLKNISAGKRVKGLKTTNYSNVVMNSKDKPKKTPSHSDLEKNILKILRNSGYTVIPREMYQNGYDIVTFDFHVINPIDFIIQLNIGDICRSIGQISYLKLISTSKIYLGLESNDFPNYPNPENTIFKLLDKYDIDIALFENEKMIILRPNQLLNYY